LLFPPAERYTIEVLFDKPGNYEIKSITPDKEYTLGKIKVSGEQINPENDFSGEFNSLGENKYVIGDINDFKQYFDKEVDINIKLSQDLHGLLKLFDSGDEDSTDNDWEKVPIGYADKIAWEDTAPRFNPEVKSSDITWILKDTNTGKKNDDIEMNFKVGDKVKIRIFNDESLSDPMYHPIHFHGQRFLVLEKKWCQNRKFSLERYSFSSSWFIC